MEGGWILGREKDGIEDWREDSWERRRRGVGSGSDERIEDRTEEWSKDRLWRGEGGRKDGTEDWRRRVGREGGGGGRLELRNGERLDCGGKTGREDRRN